MAVNYRTENAELESIKQEINCFCVKGNVSNFEDCERMTKEVIDKYGKIDVLVNNAGITKDNLLVRMNKEDFENVISVNLVGTFNMTKNVVPYMIKKRYGRIINISSVVGISGNSGQANYSASKARNNWIYKEFSKGIRFKKYISKLCCTRVYRNPDDRCFKT